MTHRLAIACVATAAAFSAAITTASAEPFLTAEGPVTLDGTDIAGKTNALTAFGQVAECPDSSYTGEAVGGGLIEPPTEEFTLVPEYNNPSCHTSSNLKATVHTNGCDYVVHVGATLGEGEYAGTVDVVCPEGKTIDIEVFLNAGNENIKACTVTIAAQKGLKGATIKDVGPGELQLGGTISGIEAAESGLCGTKSTKEATYDLGVEAVETADGELTSTGPVTLDGEELHTVGSTTALTAFGQTIECEGTTFTGHKYNVTPHETIPSGETTMTITMHWAETACKTGGGNKLTINMNGCDFVFHVGPTTTAGNNEGAYGVEADVICPAGAKIDVEIFLSGSNENTKSCTIQIGPQEGLVGAHLTDGVTAGGKKDIVLRGAFEQIKGEKSGLCGSEARSDLMEDVAVTITGTDAKGNATDVEISD